MTAPATPPAAPPATPPVAAGPASGLAAPRVRGWCPGTLRPMESGDGWVVRIRAPLGRLSPVQMRGVAALALETGNGRIDLSGRANLQLRGVTPASHPRLVAGLEALGLVAPSAAVEARSNILVTPFSAADGEDERLARGLAAALAAADAPDLPAKFGFAIDAGARPVLRAAPADIRIERDGGGGLIVAADGAAQGAKADADSAVALAIDLARWFLRNGGAAGGRGRMAAHLARQGAGGAPPLPQVFRAAPRATGPFAPPGPGAVAAGYLVALPFGQADAGTLAALAGLGGLRLTPWRMLLVEGTRHLPAIDGLIGDPGDPRLRVTACTGAPGCPQALAETRALAARLAPLVRDHLHISGCAKGCAHPGPAALTLTATPGGFDLVRGGRACDRPAATGLPADLAPHDLLPYLDPAP